jgi:hypothetical protein
VLASRDGLTEVAPGLYFSKENETVVSTFSLLGMKATWSVKKLLGKPTEVTVNRLYQILSKTLLTQAISTAFPDQAFIQMITHIKLLQKNHTFLVGACFEPNGSNTATIISSMGGMGKTSLVFKTLEEIGGKFFSDDMVIISKNGKIYSYPKPVRTRHVSIPPFDLETYVQPATLLGPNIQMKKTSRVGNLVLLERSDKTELNPLSPEDALNKLLLINRKLLPYYMERSIIAYSYMNTSFSIGALMNLETDILQNFLKDANCYVMKSRPGDVRSSIKLLRGLTNDSL